MRLLALRQRCVLGRTALHIVTNPTGGMRERRDALRFPALRGFFKTGKKSWIQADHAKRLQSILARLNASTSPADMDLPGLYLHQLTGDRQETWSVRVSGNWRVTFQFNGVHAEVVDYEDYH